MSDIISLETLTGEKPKFKPMVATYAISSGEIVGEPDLIAFRNTYKFTYTLFEINNGFEEALAKAAPPVANFFVTDGDGQPPATPQVSNITDAFGNLIVQELRHPTYSPFGTGVPLMIIQLQNLDTPIEDTIMREVQKNDR